MHLSFFTQYKVFDLEVIYIPIHFLWAIFTACGIATTLMGFEYLAQSTRLNVRISRLITADLVLIALLPCLVPLTYNWSVNELSTDVAINDFYASVWEYLPADSALITLPIQFGYDAFYWRLVYNTRTDVLLPFLQNRNPESIEIIGRDIYTTERALRYSVGGVKGPPKLIDPSYWKLPVILGGQLRTRSGRGEPLVLYQISEFLPPLIVTNPRPQISVNIDLGSAVLMGIDLNSTQAESGSPLHLVLYWKLKGKESTGVVTTPGSIPLEQHNVGFDLLPRYRNEVDLPPGSIVADRYWMVIPSTTPPGVWSLTPRKTGPESRIDKTVLLTTLEVVDQISAMERWLHIANDNKLSHGLI